MKTYLLTHINRLSSILCITGFALLFSGCCDTVAKIGGARGSEVSLNKENPGGSIVYICPGEPVTLGWFTSKDVKTASITTVGDVTMPFGTTTVYPTTSTTYVLEAKGGECPRTDKVTVEVITEGQKIQIAGTLVTVGSHLKQYYWEAELSSLLYSPEILVTSIKMVPFSDAAWNISPEWQFDKKNTDGSILNFRSKWDFTTPWEAREVPLVGIWTFYPIGGEYPNNPPQYANFEVTVKCKE
jgi:hypothetical protein